jgi:hypothetical protein
MREVLEYLKAQEEVWRNYARGEVEGYAKSEGWTIPSVHLQKASNWLAMAEASKLHIKFIEDNFIKGDE